MKKIIILSLVLFGFGSASAGPISFTKRKVKSAADVVATSVSAAGAVAVGVITLDEDKVERGVNRYGDAVKKTVDLANPLQDDGKKSGGLSDEQKAALKEAQRQAEQSEKTKKARAAKLPECRDEVSRVFSGSVEKKMELADYCSRVMVKIPELGVKDTVQLAIEELGE